MESPEIAWKQHWTEMARESVGGFSGEMDYHANSVIKSTK